MNPRIEIQKGKKIIGKKMIMSFTNYSISELWKSFLPRRQEITNNLSTELISMTIHTPTHFSDFNIVNKFEKWAAIEVSDFDNIPNDMETFVLSGGLYAVFDYKGSSSDNSIFEYIFQTWLPTSDYTLDDRPHFEVLGDKYKNNDPNSEEEIWIPIRENF